MASIWHKALDLLRGLPAVSPLALFLAARRPQALPVFLASVWRGYRASAKLRAPAVMPHQLLKDRGPFTLRLGEHGVFPGEAGLLVAELVAILQPLRTFEIGTFRGSKTALIAMNTPDAARIFTLDLPLTELIPDRITDKHLIEISSKRVGECFRSTPWNESKITQLYGNSETFDFSPYYESMDFVVIDASHSRRYVFGDTMQAFQMVRPGGVLLWHDYESMRSEYGVTWFVDRLRKHHKCPVYRLSEEPGDSRYAAMLVDGPTKDRLSAIARDKDSF
ncbi:MAG: hypothetical protein GY778_06385 [bacterium]|nr:hypothetical protein [bacterium]